ncbi:MAG TPA: valine--tRNA ligase [Caulobacterales bacterium]|nr:valine--tRNA ligase [Caulobacterales bacterium]
MIETTFNPKDVEPRWSKAWEASGAFKPAPEGEPFCIVIPPPNVTGSLHIGHALNNTLQDVLARFERLRGKSVLWQPGTDHAGIATQMVVERQLAQEGNIGRREMGRADFVKRVWAWKEQSGGRILEQLRRLGASCDWSRERFTLDEGLSNAVRKVFVQLHGEGLIYKDKRLVNWDPHFETAISDLEVVQREVSSHLWRIAYPLEDGSGEIVVATTRPETLLGDVAVAVNPSDERYKNLIGKQVRLPLTDRLIPIIGDDYADPEAGTGAVKITPAHDFNDFKVGKRHGLPLINIFTSRATLNEAAPLPFQGMDRFAAREAVLRALEEQGLRRGEEAIRHSEPHGDRSGAVVEPWLTDQWYVDAPKLAAKAIAAVEQGKTVFVPKNWEKTYFEWMRNIEPWCVSRQLWWGHRIPAWYDDAGNPFVAETEEEAQTLARLHHETTEDVSLRRDEDVLDTWFSSALWPFSTLGWPEETPELKRFYPTATLVTAHDIIFFWVARMMMMGLHFMKDVPFREVYIHALVLDEKGQKQSKAKGNVTDPLDLIDKYGADALRFTLAAMAAQGRNIKLGEQRIEGYRNFGTKLWNAARFSQMNECAVWDAYDPRSPKETVNRWIVGETAKAAAAVTADLEARRFNDAATTIYRFVWNVFCDWYLEFIKPPLSGEDESAKAETRRTTAWVLDQILILLHPFMPFITEELWARLGDFGQKRDGMLITSNWPQLPASLIDGAAEAEIDWIVGLIEGVRSTRSELNVPAAAKVPLLLIGADKASEARLERYQGLIDRMGRLEYSTTDEAAPAGAVTFVLEGATVALLLEGIVDFAAEAERLKKEIAKLDAEIAKTEAKLGNADFIARAPDEVVEEQRERLEDAKAARTKLDAARQRLEGAR